MTVCSAFSIIANTGEGEREPVVAAWFGAVWQRKSRGADRA